MSSIGNGVYSSKTPYEFQRFAVKTLLLGLASVLLLSSAGFCQALVAEEIDGVYYEVKDDGSVSVSASSFTSCKCEDAEDLRVAKKEAEIEAKAKIAKFINETVGSEETVERISASIRKRGGDDAKDVSERVRRTIEITKVSSKQILRGIVMLSNSYDEKTGKVTVTVGSNKKSQDAAGAFKNQMATDGKTNMQQNQSVSGQRAVSPLAKEF